MRVFLTSATGYIGSAIAEKLMQSGYSVIGLARSEESASTLQERGITVHRGDLSTPESLIGGVKEADVVIHTAASREPDGMKWERECVTTMLDTIAGSGKAFIYTSGASVVGDTGDSIRDETYPSNPDNPRAQLETLIYGYTQRDVRTVVIRPSFVYGRDGGILPRYIDHAKQQGIAGYVLPGDNRWSFVHVDDLATLYRLAAEKAPAGAVYNAANTQPLPMRTVSEAIAEHTGATLTAWTPKEAAPIVGGIAYAFTMNVTVSAQKAVDDLGWQPEQPDILEEITHPHAAEHRSSKSHWD